MEEAAKLVGDRNGTAHPNGSIFFGAQAALDVKIIESCDCENRVTKEKCVSYTAR